MGCADAAQHVGVELAASTETVKSAGKAIQGRTVSAMDGATEPPWMGLRRVLPWMALPEPFREGWRYSDQAGGVRQIRKTEKPARGGLFRFLLRRLALPRGLEPLF